MSGQHLYIITPGSSKTTKCDEKYRDKLFVIGETTDIKTLNASFGMGANGAIHAFTKDKYPNSSEIIKTAITYLRDSSNSRIQQYSYSKHTLCDNTNAKTRSSRWFVGNKSFAIHLFKIHLLTYGINIEIALDNDKQDVNAQDIKRPLQDIKKLPQVELKIITRAEYDDLITRIDNLTIKTNTIQDDILNLIRINNDLIEKITNFTSTNAIS